MPKPYLLPDSLHFGEDFELDVSAYELRSCGIPLKLKPNAMELLLFLVERRGQLVTRDEIVERIWGRNIFVDSDNSINSAISRIRQALRDHSDKPRFIQTVSGKGYRFIAATSSAYRSFESAQPGDLGPESCLFGRDQDIEEVCAFLQSNGARLLTLLGAGGVGKTTLAKAVARKLKPEFPDGVFFVNLMDIRLPDLVLPTIEQAFGIKDGENRIGELKNYLGLRKILLVLDNFEQVLPAAVCVGDLLASAPGLKIIVTSRALLELREEHEYVVPPLSTPPTQEESSLPELAKYGAVNLFVERARAVRPGFELTRENAYAVARICAGLDGLPLAIELAAARVKLLSPQAILSRLDHRLKLLTGGSRDVPSKHRTMTAAIEWSYDLLTEDAKRLFRSLSVFAGGFTVNSAEQVFGNGELVEPITSLVNQSLLTVCEIPGDEPRLRMLEVVREYALEHLQSSSEGKSVLSAHAQYYLSLVQEAEPILQGPDPAGWLDRLDFERDNIRAALQWSLSHDIDTAARIAAAIRYFWLFRGYLTEGLRTLRQILNSADAIDPAVRYKLLSTAGNIAKFQGDYHSARTMYEQGLSEARAAQDLSRVSLFYRGLGGLAMEEGYFDRGLTYAQQALAAAQQAADHYGIARSLNLHGDLARSAGNDCAARPFYKEALSICRRIGNKYGVSNILTNLAAAEFGVGDCPSAHAHFTESIRMCVTPAGTIEGNKFTISYALDGFAAIAVEYGQNEIAAKLAGAAQHLRDSMNYNIEPAERRMRESYMAKLQALLPMEVLADSYGLGRTFSLQQSVALALQLDKKY